MNTDLETKLNEMHLDLKEIKLQVVTLRESKYEWKQIAYELLLLREDLNTLTKHLISKINDLNKLYNEDNHYGE